VARIRKKSNRGDTSTQNKSNKAAEHTTAIPTRSNGGKDRAKQTASSPATKDAKNKKSKMSLSQGKTSKKNVMVTLMIGYAIVVGVLGLWAFNNFFLFYFTEGAPVMGRHTSTSRVANTPELSHNDKDAGSKAAGAIGGGLKKVVIHQVGPTIHFFVIVNDDVDLQAGRALGHKAVVAFADALAKPDMFGTYEAQIIVTKENLPTLDEKVILRPAGDKGEEQAFPQYGVSNKHTNGANKGISWSHNGMKPDKEKKKEE